MKLKGYKKRQLFEELILPHLPTDLQNYIFIEPFGGTFAIASYLPKRPKQLIYNDITKYNFELETNPDIEYHTDFGNILKQYDQKDVIFYLDPPYVDKENWYEMPKSADILHNDVYLKTLAVKNAKVLISYENNRKILALYKDSAFEIFTYTGSRQNFRNELLIVKK